ncbi:two component transcriptional regulator, LuxR family [Sphingomonas gellani]|uniref:Two component transcriptional regulator, LuxR family n=1 Tax=Sphingomonas gellani TaxID=1166340 RepID=A0A1H8B1S0_9SPHN|nr:response regulator transcription factor [Sphingomonas gellani]SEM76860.1 two component transcriptional regulator, LuxR family [Sphingomonas gellani]
MNGPGRVLIADDHPVTREGLCLAIRAVAAAAVIDQAATIAEAQALIRRHGRYRLVVLDDMLPDAGGFAGFMRIQHEIGTTPIALISDRYRAEQAEAARALGAAGYLDKTQSFDTLTMHLSRIANGGTVFPQEGERPHRAASLRALLDSLSSAQFRTLLASADGRSNKQVAGELGVTEATVKAHLGATFRKLGVQNRVQALLLLQPLLSRGQADAAPTPLGEDPRTGLA